MADDCSTSFFKFFLRDLGLNLFQIGGIAFKLDNSIKVFNDNKSAITLNEIGDELYNCIKPDLNNSAIVTGTEIGYLIIYFSILTAIIVIVVLIILITLKRYNKPAAIGIIAFICLCYIVIGWLFVQNSFNIISNSIVDSEDKIIKCVNDAINKLDILIEQDKQAIDKALCAYPST